MNNLASVNAATQCGNCDVAIDSNSQFCSGCGQPVWQKCDCGCMTLLTQSFCNACGTNLDQKLRTRLDNYEKLFRRFDELSSAGKYAEALSLAKSVGQAPDYRFAEVAMRARQLAERAAAELERWNDEILKARSRVARYLATDRYRNVVDVLGRIPTGMLPEDLAEILSECETKISSMTRLKTDLKTALSEKRYDDALSCLSQLVEMNPSKTVYQEQMETLVEKTVQRALEYRKAQDFLRALQLIQSVPTKYQDSAYIALLHECEEALTLRRVLATSVYLNPVLPAALDKLEHLMEGDPSIAKLRRRIQVVNSRHKTSEVWPQWMPEGDSALGAAIKPTRIPMVLGQQIDCLVKRGSQFFGAIGLATQAARNSMPHGEMNCGRRSKGVIGMFATRKAKMAATGWGVDIGDSSIKAVRLSYANNSSQPQIDQAILIPLGTGTGPNRRTEKEKLEAGIARLLKNVNLGSERVIVNLAGSDLVSRHLKLPPQSEPKRIDDFIRQEAKAHIPIDLDLLQLAYHVSAQEVGEFKSVSATLVAARTRDVEFRNALLTKAGLKVDAFLPEPFALWTAFQTIDSMDSNALPSDANLEGKLQPGQHFADMWIDVGTRRTNIVIAHPHGMWHRTLDWGLDDLNAAISKAMQITHAEADVLRREPLRAKYVQIPLDVMRAAVSAPKRELERSTFAAREALGDIQLRRISLVGGGAYQPFLSSWLGGREF